MINISKYYNKIKQYIRVYIYIYIHANIYTYMKHNIQKYVNKINAIYTQYIQIYTKVCIYKNAHFQQLRQKATNQTLNINFYNSYI